MGLIRMKARRSQVAIAVRAGWPGRNFPDPRFGATTAPCRLGLRSGSGESRVQCLLARGVARSGRRTQKRCLRRSQAQPYLLRIGVQCTRASRDCHPTYCWQCLSTHRSESVRQCVAQRFGRPEIDLGPATAARPEPGSRARAPVPDWARSRQAVFRSQTCTNFESIHA